ncbi:MAG: hypothetical protein WA634_15235 [Silvibacterium sp.]
MATNAYPQCVAPALRADSQSSRWQVRRDAFERIVGEPAILSCPATRNTLIKLQEREDAASESVSPDLYEDDEYVAYSEALTSQVQKIAIETNSQEAWKSLVSMRYSGDSPYGNWLSLHRGPLPFLIRQLSSRSFARRGTVVEVISLRLFRSRSAHSGSQSYVPPKQFLYLKSQIRLMAKTDVAFVSQGACMGLGLIGDKADIPLLQSIADSKDRDPTTRKIALDAIHQIQGDPRAIFRLRTASE